MVRNGELYPVTNESDLFRFRKHVLIFAPMREGTNGWGNIPLSDPAITCRFSHIIQNIMTANWNQSNKIKLLHNELRLFLKIRA